jgi:tetratricopeptide (TPR) repeat protein
MKKTGLLIILIFFIGIVPGFGQEQFKMDENTFQQFQRAKRMFEKGKVFFLKEKYEKAEKPLKQCLEFFPRYSQADYFLAQIYYKKQDLLKALEHMEKAKANYSFMGNLLVASQNKYFDVLRTRRKELQDVLPDLTTTSAVERTKTDIAEIDSKLTEPLPVVSEGSAEYYYFHGNIFMKLKKFNNAHAQYLEALRFDPTHANASNNLANLYYMVKNYQKALDYLNRAEANGAEINPKFKEAILKGLESKKKTD